MRGTDIAYVIAVLFFESSQFRIKEIAKCVEKPVYKNFPILYTFCVGNQTCLLLKKGAEKLLYDFILLILNKNLIVL
jgi:hypothetical protein